GSLALPNECWGSVGRARIGFIPLFRSGSLPPLWAHSSPWAGASTGTTTRRAFPGRAPAGARGEAGEALGGQNLEGGGHQCVSRYRTSAARCRTADGVARGVRAALTRTA